MKRYISFIVLVFVMLFSLIPVQAMALTNQQFWSSNDIFFFDPNDTLCGEVKTINVTSLTGKDNFEKIYNYWLAQGLTPAQSAGITANMKIESDQYSAFRQEDSQTWPNGGYGIAQFTGGQRAAVTERLKKDVGALFDQYYVAQYGGRVNESTGYIPNGVSVEVNDKFLLSELNYLTQYTSGFIPSTISARVNGLSTDYSMTIGKEEKLLDYMKTLESPTEAAIAWTYLYEYPGNIKATAADRAAEANKILADVSPLGLSPLSNQQCGVIGAGGLTYEQAKTFMKYYYDNRMQYLSAFWQVPGQSIQCTTLVVYFNNRFVIQGSGTGNGVDVAEILVKSFPSSYKLVDKNSIQPFTVFSLGKNSSTGQPGHTGIILGIGDDGSVIIGEANASLVGTNGLLESEFTGTRIDQVKGIVSAEKWESIDAWEKQWKALGYEVAEFAAPVNGSSVSKKVQEGGV